MGASLLPYYAATFPKESTRSHRLGGVAEKFDVKLKDYFEYLTHFGKSIAF